MRDLLFFSVIFAFLWGCSGGGGGGGSKATPGGSAVAIEAPEVINIGNRENYRFQGPCLTDGIANIDYSLTGENGESVLGAISCTGGRWEILVSELNIDHFSDGKITLEITLEGRGVCH